MLLRLLIFQQKLVSWVMRPQAISLIKQPLQIMLKPQSIIQHVPQVQQGILRHVQVLWQKLLKNYKQVVMSRALKMQTTDIRKHTL